MSFLSWLFGAWGCSHCEKMHRRAQAAESVAAKAIRQNDHARIWCTVASLKRRTEIANRYYVRSRARERAAIQAIRDSRLVDVQSARFPEYLEGNLDVMVDRIIAAARRTTSPQPVKP